LWLVADGTVRPFDGDIDDYTRYVLEQARGGRRLRASAKTSGSIEAPARPPGTAALHRKIREIDAGLAQIQEKIGILDRALADETLYVKDPGKAKAFLTLRAELQGQLESLEQQWLEAHSA
jgi:ATP-binding cassette subfamily F protein 3